MARIRTIKPEFFKHSGLFDAEQETGLPLRLGFAGLWVCCDREGRFKWRPRELKLDALPFDSCDFTRVLDALESRGFLVRYHVAGETFGCVPSWKRHQFINNREAVSDIPEPPNNQDIDASATRGERAEHATATRLEGKGREGDKGKDIDASEDLTPEMVTSAVMDDLRIAGRDLRIVLDSVCAREMARGMTGRELRTALVEAHRQYQAAKPRLQFQVLDAKFFGELWHTPASWPWKDGESASTALQSIKPKSTYELDAEQQREERRQRLAQVAASGSVQ